LEVNDQCVPSVRLLQLKLKRMRNCERCWNAPEGTAFEFWASNVGAVDGMEAIHFATTFVAGQSVLRDATEVHSLNKTATIFWGNCRVLIVCRVSGSITQKEEISRASFPFDICLTSSF